jgi:hypothetical protein
LGYGDPNIIEGPHSEADIQSRINESISINKFQAENGTSTTIRAIFGERSAVLLIFSNQDWSGTVLDSSGETIDRGSYTVHDGIQSNKMFECMTGGIYSKSFQKGTDRGYLDLILIKADGILDEGSTTADYGIVSLYRTSRLSNVDLLIYFY